MTVLGLNLNNAKTLILIAIGTLALTACGGGSAVNLDTPGVDTGWPGHAWEQGVKSGSYSLVAVDDLGQRAERTTGLLSLDVDTTSQTEVVAISTSDVSGSPSWYLHLQYDPNETHPVAVNAAEGIADDVLVIGITQVPGVVCIGLAPIGGGELPGGQTELATVEFADGPFRGERMASVVSASTVDDLRFDFTNNEMLTWSFKSTGDYDQNSEVNIADITPIAIHFQVKSGDPSWPAALVADGDENTEINLSDITPIAVNFRNRITDYRIKAGPSELGPFGQITDGDVPRGEGQEPAQGGFLRYEEVLASPVDNAYYIVVALDGADEASGISNAVQYTGEAPVAHPPSNLIATVPVDVFHLEWDAPAGSLPDSYDVYVATSQALLATTPAIGSGIVDTTFDLPSYVTPDNELYFGVKADYGGQLSEFSNIVHFTPGGGTEAPVWDIAGQGIKAVFPGDGQVSLEWYEATEAVNPPVEYLLYYAESSTGIDWDTHQETHSGGLSKVITGLTNDTSYDFGVRATNFIGATTTNTNFLSATPTEEGGVPFDTGVWQPSELVDDGGPLQPQEPGHYTDIEVAGDGTIGIVHYNNFTRDLMYTSGTAGNWSTEIVSSQGDTGLYADLEFHPVDGHPCIAFHNVDEASLEYAEFNGMTWDIETVDSGGDRGAFASLEFDPADNNPAISYFDSIGQDLRYAKWDGSEWDTTLVYNGNPDGTFDLTGAFTGLAFNPVTGNPGISFSKSYYSAPVGMMACWYAESNGSSWSSEEADLGDAGDIDIGSAGWGTSLAYSSTGIPNILHIDYFHNQARLAEKSAGFWQATSVGSTAFGLLTLNDMERYDGGVAWVYYDSISGACKFGTGFGPASTVESGGVGGTPTLAVDGEGEYHLAYLDVSNNQLRYASGDGFTWDIETADAGEPAQPIVGEQASLAYDPASGFPMVSYHDSSVGSLKFADKQPGTWRNEVVASGKNEGAFSQMGVDDSGTAFLGYFYVSPSDDSSPVSGLSVADGSFGNWDISIIQEANLATGGQPVGMFLSLDMNSMPSNYPGISYFNLETSGLEFALGASGDSYEQTDIDGFNNAGRWSSTAFNPANKMPGVAYYRRDTGDLFYCEREGGGNWTPEPVDTVQDVGNRCAMTYVTDFIVSPKPWISYYDSTNNKLKVAYDEGLGWEFVDVPAPGGSTDYGSYSTIANHPIHARASVVFYDNDNGKLWYMFIGDPDNPQAAVEIAGVDYAEGTFPSLEFNPLTNQPGVAYQDGTNGDLRYVWREGS